MVVVLNLQLHYNQTNTNTIPLGTPMTKESICQNIQVDENKYKHLLKLNKQLEQIANKMLLKLDTVSSADSNIEKNVINKKSNIKSLLDKIKRQEVDKKTQQINIIHRQQQDSHTVYMSNNYHMIAWGLLVVTISGFSISALLK